MVTLVSNIATHESMQVQKKLSNDSPSLAKLVSQNTAVDKASAMELHFDPTPKGNQPSVLDQIANMLTPGLFGAPH